MERKKRDACADFVCAWEKVTPQTIQKAFNEIKSHHWGNPSILIKATEYEHWEHHVEASKLSKKEREEKRIELQN